jgi:ComEC/Rec2-related protein
MELALPRSRKFLLFWVLFLAGLAVGSRFSLPMSSLLWFAGLWLVLLVSGQDERIELTSLIALGFLGGMVVWSLTGGEAWLKLAALEKISQWLVALRATVIDRLYMSLPEPHGSILTAIMFGNRVRLNYDTLEMFRVVGLSHIIAVSGFHLSILTANLQTLFRPLLGRKVIFVALAFIFAFVIITGAPPSILRASVMAGVLLLAGYIGRPTRSVNVLLLAAGVLAAFEPKIIFQIGFQLSVAATYGIIRLSPMIQWALRRATVPEILKGVISQTLAATISTAPLLVVYFERLSIVSPLTNLLVVPLVPLLMAIALVAVLLLLAVPTLGEYFALLTWPLLEWVVQVSRYLGSLPFAATDAHLSSWGVALIILAMISSLEILSVRFRRLASLPLERLMWAG